MRGFSVVSGLAERRAVRELAYHELRQDAMPCAGLHAEQRRDSTKRMREFVRRDQQRLLPHHLGREITSNRLSKNGNQSQATGGLLARCLVVPPLRPRSSAWPAGITSNLSEFQKEENTLKLQATPGCLCSPILRTSPAPFPLPSKSASSSACCGAGDLSRQARLCSGQACFWQGLEQKWARWQPVQALALGPPQLKHGSASPGAAIVATEGRAGRDRDVDRFATQRQLPADPSELIRPVHDFAEIVHGKRPI